MGLFASADAFQIVDTIDDREILDKIASRLNANYATERNPSSVIVHADVQIELRVSKIFGGLARLGIFMDEELSRKSRNEQAWKVFGPLVDSGAIAAIRFSKPGFFAVALHGAERYLYGQCDVVEWLARNESAHNSIFRREPSSDLSILSLTIRHAHEIKA